MKIPAAVEVQFSTTERIGETVTRIGVTKEGVTEAPIPDTLLEGGGTTQDYTIYAFVYIENGDSGKTEYRVSIKVRARPKPEAHATPEEGELFRQAIVAVAESADRAESARKSAETSADEAKTAKENAETAVKNAEAFKTEAETAKNDAVQAKEAAEKAKIGTAADREVTEAASKAAQVSAVSAEKSAEKAETAKEEIQESADQIQKNATEIDSLKEDIDNIIYKGLINGFNKDNTVSGYLSNNGNVNSNPGFVTSDYFDVHENKTYYALQMVGTVKYDTVAYICFYDSSKAFIAGGYFNASSCTSPNGSKYARVSFPSDETTKARCMFTNIETPDKYYPFGYEYSIITKDVSELKTRKSENRLHGKTMAILGDSMAKGHTLNEKQTWAYKIANRNGMVYQKLAINGTFITTGHGDADANCLLEQAKKINNNPDIIVIHMGTNDRNKNVELGRWTIGNTDTTNLFGALRVAFTYLAENFPLAQVMFITPYYYQEQTDYIGSIEKACMYVGCHCKNNKQGGIFAWNTNVRNALFLDYVHLNEVGQERASYEYEGFMRTFM
ncbi:GDSL-type esterase/lipase family protein [[Ruminococcus] lactaris]|nr:GDSL-type esterase/lipase family protein [[Ruminococcus] lactaris]